MDVVYPAEAAIQSLGLENHVPRSTCLRLQSFLGSQANTPYAFILLCAFSWATTYHLHREAYKKNGSYAPLSFILVPMNNIDRLDYQYLLVYKD